jgi:hypothetical protein
MFPTTQKNVPSLAVWQMRRPDVTLRFHFIGIMVALAVILYVVWEASQHGRTRFAIGDDTMAITVTEEKGGLLAYYYAVRRADVTMVPKTHFRDGGGWWPPQYKLMRGADPDVVAVTERDDPRAVLILYDTAAGRSWPADANDAGSELLARFSGRSGKGYYMSGLTEPNARE